MSTREQRIAELEKASEGLGQLATQRDGLQAELSRALEESADLRRRLEAVQAQAVARAESDAELLQLVSLSVEALGRAARRLEGMS